MLSQAILAPNPHNRQPWRVDLGEPDAVTLYCDTGRLLPETDPLGRQILIGLGAFTELAVIGAGRVGLQAEVTPFPAGPFPADRIDGRPVARIALRPGGQADPLAQAIARRRSTKTPFGPEALDQAHAARLIGAATGPGTRFGWTSEAALSADLRAIGRDAFVIEMETPRTYRESVELMRIGSAEIAANPDGIPLHGPLMWWLARLGLLDRRSVADPASSAFAAGRDQYTAMITATPSFGWLVTPGNDRFAQFAAGRAYARLDLTAAALGVALHPISQVLQEYPEMADLQARFDRRLGLGRDERVQMLVRLGYAKMPGPSPRWPVATTIRT
jgi:nitroreductase